MNAVCLQRGAAVTSGNVESLTCGWRYIMKQHWSTFCSPGSRDSGVKICHLISCIWVCVCVFSFGVTVLTAICVLVSVLAWLTSQCCILLPRGCQLALLCPKVFRVESGKGAVIWKIRLTKSWTCCCYEMKSLFSTIDLSSFTPFSKLKRACYCRQ